MRFLVSVSLVLVAAAALAPVAVAEPTAPIPAGATLLEASGPMHSFAGNDVARAGDVNGDGHADLLVSGNSVAWVLFGPTGTGTRALDAPGAAGLRIDATGIWDFTSITVAGAGDVNRDGFDDVVVGVRGDDNNGRTNSGSAYVVFGSASSEPITLPDLGSRGFRIDGAAAGDQVGTSVDGAGDVNRDGLADVVIGTEGMGNNRTGRSAYVVFGSASTATVLLNAADLGARGVRINGDRLERPGAAVAGAGDVNRDGYADVLVGAPWADPAGRLNAGSAYLIYGRSGHATVWLDSLGTRGTRIDGAVAGDFLGTSVSGAGDFSGDGRPDLLLGAPGTDDGAGPGDGKAFVVFGRAFGPTADLAALGADGVEIRTPFSSDDLGRVVAPAGDLIGDGRADVLVGAPMAGNAAGAAYLVGGRAAGGMLNATDLGQTGRVVAGSVADDRLGTGIAGVGDVTGDGLPDLAVGAPRSDAAVLNGGLVRVLSGVSG